MIEKIKKFYNSELYIKLIYGIPALLTGGIASIIFLIFSVQIIFNIFLKEDLDYDKMIKEYRYNHKLYHQKDMERMDRILELMSEINRKTKKSK